MKKSFKEPYAVYNRRRVLSGTQDVLGNVEACTADDIEVVVPLKSKTGVCGNPSGQECISDQECDDYCTRTYTKAKTVLIGSVSDGASASDKDSLTFTCLPPVTPAGTCTEVFEVADSADLIGGNLAQGRVGDWMLRNGDIRVLVRDVGRAQSFMRTFGGHILDADIVRKDPSEDRDSFNDIIDKGVHFVPVDTAEGRRVDIDAVNQHQQVAGCQTIKSPGGNCPFSWM